MRVDPRKYGAERRRLLDPLARSHGLDYAVEVVCPGETPVQIAFQLIACGADLLSGLRYPDSIPTADRRAAKRAAKSLAKRFHTDEAGYAAGFLVQAMATWFAETVGRSGDSSSAAVHLLLRDLVELFFPLDPADRSSLEDLRAEYRVMDDHDTTGRVPATGWYMALRDPEFAEGRDVDTDPELIEAQMRYASRYLRLGAECRAIALCVGEDAFQSIEPQLFYPHWPGWEILEYDVGDLSWWTSCAESFHQVGERAIAADVL